MYKKLLFIFLFCILFVSALNAEETDIKDTNLQNNWGVEINPFYLTTLDTQDPMFTAGISYFNYDDSSEITMPVSYSKYVVQRSKDNTFLDYNEINLNIDLHYRKFFNSQVSGPYLGIFTRYTYLEGKLKEDTRFSQVHKIGIGLEFGARIMNIMFFNLPLYWGWSVAVGKYYSDNNDVFLHESLAMYMNDPKVFFDIELLKIGVNF